VCVDKHIVWFGQPISLWYKVWLVKLTSIFDKNEVPEGHSGLCAYEKEVSERNVGVFPHRNSTAVIILSLEAWHRRTKTWVNSILSVRSFADWWGHIVPLHERGSLMVVRTCILDCQRNPNTGQESHSPGDSWNVSAYLQRWHLSSSLKNIYFINSDGRGQGNRERWQGTEHVHGRLRNLSWEPSLCMEFPFGEGSQARAWYKTKLIFTHYRNCWV